MTEIFYDKERPQFHYTPRENWMNDPNGLVFYDGEYHLFYQHNPCENKWGHLSWGHAISIDLINWTEYPIAIKEDEVDMIFSGCVVVDWNNSSGFSADTIVPLVAIYTGHRKIDNRQYQCLAYSIDKGRSWKKYQNNPVLDIQSDNFRDPKVFWFKEQKKWIMVVALSSEKTIYFYSSTNLLDWQHLSKFSSYFDNLGGWECPDLFPLKLDDNTTKWVLTVSVIKGAPSGGSGMFYFIGTFDGHTFIPGQKSSQPNWIDFGADFYAAVTFSNIPEKNGSRIWIGWINNWDYADKIPTTPWRGMMSIPRELELKYVDRQIRLIQHPIKELKQLRKKEMHFSNISFVELNNKFNAIKYSFESVELYLEIENKDSYEYGIALMNENNETHTKIGYKTDLCELYLDRTNSGLSNFSKQFPVIHKATINKNKEIITLHIFIDKISVEVFCNNGEQVISDLIFPTAEKHLIKLFANQAMFKIQLFSIWQLS